MLDAFAVLFLVLFVLYLAEPRRGGHRPPKSMRTPHRPPPTPADASTSARPRRAQQEARASE